LTASRLPNTRFAANLYTDAKICQLPAPVDVFNHFVDASGNVLPNAPKLAILPVNRTGLSARERLDADGPRELPLA